MRCHLIVALPLLTEEILSIWDYFSKGKTMMTDACQDI